MSRTIGDLNKAVKRFLTSNTNLVNLVPGQAQNADALMAEIDAGIMEASNNARLHAEKMHDFSANEALGKAVLTFGAPVNLDRVPIKRFYSGTASETVVTGNVVGIESSLRDFPELTLNASEMGSRDVSKVQTVCFGGNVHSPLVGNTEYTVVSTRTNSDLTTTMVLGIAPGIELDVSGSSVIFNTGEIKRFKTIKSAWLISGATMRPIKVQRLQTKMIELTKNGERSDSNWYPRYGKVGPFVMDYELTINGRFGHITPVTDSVTIGINGNVWMNQYTHESDTDFLLDNGFDFMMWQCIIEMNFILLKYVARQEGTLSPPTQARDAAWDALVLWDSHSTDGNIYHDL